MFFLDWCIGNYPHYGRTRIPHNVQDCLITLLYNIVPCDERHITLYLRYWLEVAIMATLFQVALPSWHDSSSSSHDPRERKDCLFSILAGWVGLLYCLSNFIRQCLPVAAWHRSPSKLDQLLQACYKEHFFTRLIDNSCDENTNDLSPWCQTSGNEVDLTRKDNIMHGKKM